MTVERKFPILDLSEVLLGRRIQESSLLKILQGIPYLYDAIGAEAPPNSGAQVISGHDHAELGGRPITRGCCFSKSGGQQPLWTVSPTPQATWSQLDVSASPRRDDNTATMPSKSQGTWQVVYASPGIDTRDRQVYWECRLFVDWPSDAKGNVQIRITNKSLKTNTPWVPVQTTVVSREIEPSADLQEVVLHVPVGSPTVDTEGDHWNSLDLDVRRKTSVTSTTEDLRIWRVSIHETELVSKPRSKGRIRYR